MENCTKGGGNTTKDMGKADTSTWTLLYMMAFGKMTRDTEMEE